MKLLSDPEALGAYTGIPGAFLLAMNNSYSHYGWLLFLASNICWILFAINRKFTKMLFQQLAFLATTLMGIGNTFFPSLLGFTWLRHFTL